MLVPKVERVGDTTEDPPEAAVHHLTVEPAGAVAVAVSVCATGTTMHSVTSPPLNGGAGAPIMVKVTPADRVRLEQVPLVASA